MDVNAFAVWSSMSSKSNPEALKDQSCGYEPQTLPNTNVGAAKDHGKTRRKSDLPSPAILCVIVYYRLLSCDTTATDPW